MSLDAGSQFVCDFFFQFVWIIKLIHIYLRCVLEDYFGMSFLSRLFQVTDGIRVEGKTVYYDASNEDLVDTSVSNNPTYSDEYGDDVRVYSIFKRKSNTEEPYDGNPLLYALKGERGYHFAEDYDREAVENQFRLIARKIKESSLFPSGVVSVVLPSGNSLNRHIVDVLQSEGVLCEVVEGAIVKMTAIEVYDEITADDSYFRQKSGADYDANLRRFRNAMRRMDSDRGGMFAYHFLPPDIRGLVLSTMRSASDELLEECSKAVNGRDVLLIDDSISRGQSIKNAVSIMQECYYPKSITVLTLFSKLY